MSKMNAADRLTKSKIYMQNAHPFYSYLVMCMGMRDVTADKEFCNTMAVDQFGKLYYDANFVETLTDPQVRGVLAHEILHVISAHPGRGKRYNKEIWNWAVDIKVNDIVVQEHDMELPKMALVPDRYHKWKAPMKDKDGKDWYIEKVNELAAEEIYELLIKRLPQIEQYVKQHGSPGFDDHMPGSGDGDGDEEGNSPIDSEIPDEWKDNLASAAQVARQRGKLPAGLERLVEDMTESKISWKEYLMKFVSAQIPVDFTYSTPSKKSFSTGVYMPSVIRESVECVVHIDSSGSTWSYLADFLGEIEGILSSFEYINMTLIICDAEIQDVFELSKQDLPDVENLKVRGWGGTSHYPVVKWINDEKPDAKIFISLTDGYSDIERCYPDLPDSCHNLVVLVENYHGEEHLRDHADVIHIK